jgi:hypothetical protein
MKRTVLITCLAAVLLLAMAAPAFAQPDGTSGTVYGKAILAPCAIVISGGGVDEGEPLTYQGNLGEWADEEYGNRVTVQNVGTQPTQITIAANELPTAGSNVWGLNAYGSGADSASWTFWGWQRDAAVLSPSDPEFYMGNSVLDWELGSGDSDQYFSRFQFPTSSSSSADHFMSATISAEPLY